jgi:flagellar biosynthetic protein FlhB
MAAGANGERTEQPTARRLKEARERGQVARSRDLSSALSLAAMTIVLGWAGFRVWSGMADRLASSLAALGDQPRAGLDAGAIAGAFWADAGRLALLVGPLALAAAVVSIGASLAQVGWQYSPKAVRLDWTRISPATGFGRFAPAQSGAELAKSLVCLAAVAALCIQMIRGVYNAAPEFAYMAPGASAEAAWQQLWTLLWRASLVLAALGAADYGLQRWRWKSQLKMTRQEVKDDAKLNDGNPEIKARVRRVQREMTKRRMLHAVKTATVVIVNPTHVSVALQYSRQQMAAPVVVAKGVDELAARIRTVAREHGVPIVENVTLARALHASTDVGDAIPADLFGAVAEVLAYLVRLKQLML